MANYITNLFGRSPIKPLQEHMRIVNDCVTQLGPLFDAVVANDQDRVATSYKQISALEHEADDLKKALRHQLPKGMFMPVDRRDLLEVLLMQDKIANQAKDVAGLILGRGITLPETMHELFLRFGERCQAATAKALETIQELDELLETGFRGREVDRVEEMLSELDDIESETDKIQIELRRILFDIENEMRAVDAIFLYRLIEWIGNVADCAQRVGSRLQLLLAR